MDPSVLARKQLTELKSIAAHLDMRGYQRLKKAELIDAIVSAARERGGMPEVAPSLDAGGDGTRARNGDGAEAAEDVEGVLVEPHAVVLEPDGFANRRNAIGESACRIISVLDDRAAGQVIRGEPVLGVVMIDQQVTVREAVRPHIIQFVINE